MAASGPNGIIHEPIGSLASEVVPERVSWVWPGRLAEGMMSMLDGNPGLGKSTIALDIAARVTTGAPFPGQQLGRTPRGVVVLSAEDSESVTIVPRLGVAGAVLERVYILRSAMVDGEDRNFTIPNELPVLERAIALVNAALVIIDPLLIYFSQGINANIDQDVSTAMRPLKDVLERTNTAAVMLRHLTKAEAKEAVYRGGGSIGIIGRARFGMIAAKDPDEEGAVVVASSKCNIGQEPPSLRYRLQGVEGTDVARVIWDEDSSRHWTANDLMEAAGGSVEDREERSEVEEWLAGLLANGPVPSVDIWRDAKKSMYSRNAVFKAKSTAGIKAVKNDYTGGWSWQLPRHDAKNPTVPDTGTLRTLRTVRDPSLHTTTIMSSNIPRVPNNSEASEAYGEYRHREDAGTLPVQTGLDGVPWA
jgi:hypothetical protein